MKKIEYTDESDFITREMEFEDEHYELATKLHEKYQDSLLSKCSPMLVRSKGDKKALLFCVNLGDRDNDRVAYERGDNLYRIIIEKIR